MIFLTCDVRLLVRKVREPNQADPGLATLQMVFLKKFKKKVGFVCAYKSMWAY